MEKVISSNISLPSTGSHSNINLPDNRGISTLVFRASFVSVISQNKSTQSIPDAEVASLGIANSATLHLEVQGSYSLWPILD